MIVNILEGRPLPIYGDGLNIRDWLHVSDHCKGIEQVICRGTVGETYNIGGRAERRNIDLVKALCAIADDVLGSRPGLRERFPRSPAARGNGCETLITYVKDRPGHDRRYAIDCSKIERELGFRPAYAIEDGLRQTFEWYVDNEAWWRSVMDGSYRQWIDANYAARR
jgi:dTDP-glucose 4,6-dehydratase